jgi:UDP-sugar transporter A1/2/3
MHIQDTESVRQNGFFYGYNSIVWFVIFLGAIGGLVIAVVIKYADNILKGFASAFSMVIAIICSYLLFPDYVPSKLFFLGAVYF